MKFKVVNDHSSTICLTWSINGISSEIQVPPSSFQMFEENVRSISDSHRTVQITAFDVTNMLPVNINGSTHYNIQLLPKNLSSENKTLIIKGKNKI